MKLLMNRINIRKHKILVVFDDMIPDLVSNKKQRPRATDLFVSSREVNTSYAFYHEISFCCAKKREL